MATPSAQPQVLEPLLNPLEVGPGKKFGMGWLADYPDFRDYTEETAEIKLALRPTGVRKAKSLRASADLREWCSPIENQGKIGSCTKIE